MDINSEELVSWEKYKEGDDSTKKVRLTQQGECPYMKITLLRHEFEAQMDSGAGLSLISRSAARKLMNSKEWKNSSKKPEGKPVYRTDEIVSAVNCDGRPLHMTGKLVLPTMAIGKHDLK